MALFSKKIVLGGTNFLARATSSAKPSSSSIFKPASSSHINTRYASGSSAAQSSDPKQSDESKPSGWLDKVFSSNRIHTGNRPHSRLLSASEFIYEMHYHDSRPDSADNYIDKYEKYSHELIEKTKKGAELVASFRVEVGNQDQFIHIWRYHDYVQMSNIHEQIRTDKQLVELNKDLAKNLVNRESQMMMSFSFWDHPQPSAADAAPSCYELRSYVLKPGTMIEWANGWSKGINSRSNGVGGWFSGIGQLYNVHHLWRYENLQVRKEVRESAWARPGWDTVVGETVPLIRDLKNRWMIPNKFSPIR